MEADLDSYSNIASSIISWVRSAVDDVQKLVEARSSPQHKEMFKMLKFRLQNLKTFVLCAGMLGYSEDLKSCLACIEDTVRRKAEEIHPHCVDLSSTATRLHVNMASDFQEDIQCLEEEMGEWYHTIMEDESINLTSNEVLPIIRSVLESLEDFCSLRSRFLHAEIAEQMVALGEQLTFLQCLVHFVKLRSTEPREDLLAHAQTVAVNAADLIFTCRVENFDQGMQLKISNLLQIIKPSDSRVFELYTQALSDSKLQPTQDLDGVATIDLLDSLICLIWRTLLQNSYELSTPDQLQELCEELRSLQTILKQLPDNVDVKIKEDIENVVCDTGVLICSFDRGMELHSQLEYLVETVKNIASHVGDRNQPLLINASRTNALSSVDFLIERLKELIGGEAEPSSKIFAQNIRDGLVYARTCLVEIMELGNEREELQALWSRVLELAYDIEFLMEHLMIGDLPESFSSLFHSVNLKIHSILGDVLKIKVNTVPQSPVSSPSQTNNVVGFDDENYTLGPSQSSPSITNEVVGLDDDARSIMDLLTGGSKRLRIVAIVGFPGLGKTTLASKVYNDPQILYHFHVRAWCPISQVYDNKRVLLDLVSQVDPNMPADMSEHDLATKLWRSLRGKRYLIFLDDVWDIEAWNSMELAFPDDNMGSRIILTSRNDNVAPKHLLDPGLYSLKPLKRDQSLELLRRKLFPELGSWPRELLDLGKEISENCKGLPLSIVIIAGLLAATDQGSWKRISDSLRSSIESSAEQTLELSFSHLPDHLRPCLLYFGAFSEDQEISVRRLIRIWIAEGLVRKTETNRLEDVAEGYLDALVGRSLVIVSKLRSDGGVKAFRIHDLIHDLCLRKSRSEQFFYALNKIDNLLEFHVQHNLWRLRIDSDPEHFKDSKLFCPRARSLLFSSSHDTQSTGGVEILLDISTVVHFFKCLKVLDLEQIDIGCVLPSEIDLLARLAFLAIRGKLKEIPSSIGKLSNLETLIVDPRGSVLSLPSSLWDLQKLEYVCIRSSHNAGGAILPVENINDETVLQDLDKFSGAIIPSWSTMERVLIKFPNVRKLKCKLFQHRGGPRNLDRIVVPDHLHKLESLHMSRHSGLLFKSKFDFSLPGNLKKLTLSGFSLYSGSISTIGQLPNLEVLKLLRISFEGDTLEMGDGEFLKLRVLTFAHSSIARWGASDDDHLEVFEKLVLNNCRHLKEIPDLENITTLDAIEVYHCSESVVKLVMDVEEKWKEWGHSGLKIVIQSK